MRFHRKRWKKRVVVFLALTVLIVFLSSSFSSVSAAIAPGTYTDHQNASATVLIDIGGPYPIAIDAFHYDSGSLGAGEVIRITLHVSDTLNLPLAIFTDIPNRIGLFQKIYAGYPTSINLINDPKAIDISRPGMSKTVHVVWKTDLTVPQENWMGNVVPTFTIPPGMLVFRGHGDVLTGSSSSGVTGKWSQTVTSFENYYRDATFVCQTWDFGGPVGVNTGVYPTLLRFDTTVVTTVY
jgi:hypothetical protein